MSIFYIDCGAGVAGDMLLGAWIGLGLHPLTLERTLKKALGVSNWRLKVEHVERQGWPARTVTVAGDRPFGGPRQMKRTLARAKLSAGVKRRALRIIDALAWAENQAHGHPSTVFDPQGLGLLDTLVDVVGNAWAISHFEDATLRASAVHGGRLAPASVHLAKRFKIPLHGQSFSHELATPTGLAILGESVSSFGPLPVVRLENAGYGAGFLDTPGRPNVLAVYRILSDAKIGESETVVLLETLIDDMDPRIYPYVAGLLSSAGALDVWWTPVGMKKGRPGLAFCALAKPEDEEKLMEILFRETTTLGIRRLPMERRVLKRESRGMRKFATLPDGSRKSQSEFELARRQALRSAKPLRMLLK
jgi:pyridinium-3,5-bisthiocarboxylic acid mononucleotide nickel chelatase